jgi:hypothetical protein
MAKRTLGAFLLILAFVVSANSQETTPTPQPTTDTTTTPAIPPAATTPAYVFPDKGKRFNRYVNSTIGPFRLGRTAVSAGFDQWRDSPEEWGQGMKGYGKRFASGLGRNAIQQTVGYGLDEAFQLDSGFYRSKREGFGPRLKDALLQGLTSRTRSGKRVPAVPRFVGAYSGAIIASETWYPERYTYKDGLRSGSTSLLIGFGINVFREFVMNW